MPRIILMNPNSNAGTTRDMVAIAGRILDGVEGWTAPEGPGMLVTGAALEEAARLVGAAEPGPADAIMVAAFGDPGRAALAARLACPVIGIGAAAARASGAGGRRFAVVTTTPGLEQPIDRLMRAHAGAGRYIGCHFAEGDALALMADPDRLDAALLQAAGRAAQAGAEVAIIGGGPLGRAADRLAGRAPVPLIAPIPAAAQEIAQALAGADPDRHP